MIQKKSFRFIIKLTLTDEIKILDPKIKANQAQYNLDREAAEISHNYECLTGKDLEY